MCFIALFALHFFLCADVCLYVHYRHIFFEMLGTWCVRAEHMSVCTAEEREKSWVWMPCYACFPCVGGCCLWGVRGVARGGVHSVRVLTACFVMHVFSVCWCALLLCVAVCLCVSVCSCVYVCVGLC